MGHQTKMTWTFSTPNRCSPLLPPFACTAVILRMSKMAHDFWTDIISRHYFLSSSPRKGACAHPECQTVGAHKKGEGSHQRVQIRWQYPKYGYYRIVPVLYMMTQYDFFKVKDSPAAKKKRRRENQRDLCHFRGRTRTSLSKESTCNGYHCWFAQRPFLIGFFLVKVYNIPYRAATVWISWLNFI